MAFKVDRGVFGTVPLDGLGFIVLGLTPKRWAKGTGRWASSRTSARTKHSVKRSPRLPAAPRRSDGRADRSGRQVPRRRSRAHPVRAGRHHLVGDRVEVRRHGGEGCDGYQPRGDRAHALDGTGHPANDGLASITRSRAMSTPWVSRGTQRAATTDTMRPSPGATRSTSQRSRLSSAGTASSSRSASPSFSLSPGPISSTSIARCRRPWRTTRKWPPWA